MKKGVVKFFNAGKKFGFIISMEEKAEYYVHIKDVIGQISEGDTVLFEIAPSKKGLKAVKVTKTQ